MFRVEIAKVRALSYRDESRDGQRSTVIHGEDTEGCEFEITLQHDGRTHPRRPATKG